MMWLRMTHNELKGISPHVSGRWRRRRWNVSHPKGRVIWWTLSAPSLSSKESQEDSLVNLILNFRLRLPTPPTPFFPLTSQSLQLPGANNNKTRRAQKFPYAWDAQLPPTPPPPPPLGNKFNFIDSTRSPQTLFPLLRLLPPPSLHHEPIEERRDDGRGYRGHPVHPLTA